MEKDVSFVLFTRNHAPIDFNVNGTKTYWNQNLSFDKQTKVIIHGFRSSIEEDIFVLNKNAYLQSGDFNVIGLDWSPLCNSDYFSAIRGMHLAAEILYDFLTKFRQNGGDFQKIHLVGHSLGAHLAGIAAFKLRNQKIKRITGLDPAAPGFRDVEHRLKLDHNDAQLVDVIHTYMKVLSFSEPMGHVDFYPNGGRFQPGCPHIYDVLKMAESILCNHSRAYYFFAESILDRTAFKSNHCLSVDDALYSRCQGRSTVYMGQEETYQFGLYYVKTRDKQPYSLKTTD